MGRVLLTGASGAIGAEVAALLAGGGERVLALLHRERRIVRNDGRVVPLGAAGGVEAVAGDVSQPRFGLAPEAWERLREGLDAIVHAAAVTDFGRPEQLYRSANVDGTRTVLDLASGSARPIPLVHVSTAYVCGERQGVVREDELATGQSFANGYERSKHDAELLVRAAAARGLPVTIARPSIVVGSSRSGVTRDFKGMYTFVKLLVEGRLSLVPANYDALVDFVAIDYVAEAIADLARRAGETAGATVHLVGATPLTLREIGDVLAEYPSFAIPRFVPPQSFDVAQLEPLERRYHRRVGHLFTPYLARHVVFATDQARQVVRVRQGASGKPLLRRLIDHALRTGYVGAPTPSIGAVLAGLPQPAPS
jgi:thioester reductase-like protein